ncbi:hypothetical protein [Alkalihalobacillus pseudalcaliphilus]|uniref:hypothetical protein n=1 Tax=Alkalihalobacillus pseudalcaliphilus TaxID=79884 RepID=UPI00064DED65|nr:hypothetical protein [Alkalihalobacillus pseudalcaliphilus]KMK77078.1 hypothetical protein AB990_05875 [Alkalihalobacillus pseudalcaliphilus]
MKEFVFFIDGEVAHPLTIDPSVWIFDERKVHLKDAFTAKEQKEDPEIAYRKAISAQWDKEIIEGNEAPNPNSNDNKISYNKKELFQSSYGIAIEPFIRNANPSEKATAARIVTKSGEAFTYSLADITSMIAGFSYEGKPLKDDGPIHLYFADGSNRENPIKDVQRISLI